MNSDLVNQLRSPIPTFERSYAENIHRAQMLCGKAADEIEQLRAEIRRLIKECDAAYQIINDMP